MGTFADMANDILSGFTRFQTLAQDVITEEFDKAYDAAEREYGPIEVEKMKDVFRQAVDSFYGAYTPIYYNRRGGLYDVLEVRLNDEGQADTESYDLIDMLNPDALHTDREGGSLFDKVFLHGWHGGATGTDRTGKSVSVPHYRVPYERYSRWGRRAVQSEAPASIFRREFLEADKGELQDIFDELVDRHIKDEALPQISNRLLDLFDKCL